MLSATFVLTLFLASSAFSASDSSSFEASFSATSVPTSSEASTSATSVPTSFETGLSETSAPSSSISVSLASSVDPSASSTPTSSGSSPTPTFVPDDIYPYDPGFDIRAVVALAEELPTHSWEYGTAAEALLELHNGNWSVFGSAPFPVPAVDKKDVKSLTYAADRITIGAPPDIFADGDGAVGDPFSLGTAAIMLGKSQARYAIAVEAEMEYLLNRAPRWWNGAISHRADVAELWADWMYMVPPAFAYYAIDSNQPQVMVETLKQCEQYREVLQANITDPWKGVWHHIVGPQSPELGLWSTGNAWAVGGMSRVLATIHKAPKGILEPAFVDEASGKLVQFIKEILDGALASPRDDNLLRNYLNDTTTGHGFGEISGTTLMASVSYRLAVLLPEQFGSKYVEFADDVLKTIAGKDKDGKPHVTSTGVVTPAVNPLGWGDVEPWTTGSPEGNNFVVLLYAAWRDCIQANHCAEDGGLKNPY